MHELLAAVGQLCGKRFWAKRMRHLSSGGMKERAEKQSVRECGNAGTGAGLSPTPPLQQHSTSQPFRRQPSRRQHSPLSSSCVCFPPSFCCPAAARRERPGLALTQGSGVRVCTLKTKGKISVSESSVVIAVVSTKFNKTSEVCERMCLGSPFR